MAKVNYIFLLVFVFIGGLLKAQDVEVTAKLDTNIITIGDQVTLKLKVMPIAQKNIQFPMLAGKIFGKLEVLKETSIDTIQNNGKQGLEKGYILTVFEPCTIDIDTLFRVLVVKDSITDTLYPTGNLSLIVNAVEVDTTQPIKDIKLPLQESYTFAEFWQDYRLYIIGFFVLLLTIVLIIIVVKRIKSKKPILPFFSKPKLPAHEIALIKLEELRNKKLWQNDLIKEYYTELTSILREYIEGRYGIQAEEMTTDEILDALKRVDIDKNDADRIEKILRLADLVKFAKHKPLPDEHTASITGVIDFVKNTKIIIEDKKE